MPLKYENKKIIPSFTMTMNEAAKPPRAARSFPLGRFYGDPAQVWCPACHSYRIEKYMRAVVYPNDPMRCGTCGLEFEAHETAVEWKEWPK